MVAHRRGPAVLTWRRTLTFYSGGGIGCGLGAQDANLSVKRAQEAYLELILAMRVMHQKCKLVHADLSEYNILYHEGHLVIIDVSQVSLGAGWWRQVPPGPASSALGAC